MATAQPLSVRPRGTPMPPYVENDISEKHHADRMSTQVMASESTWPRLSQGCLRRKECRAERSRE
eukprot:5972420-Heterocapsa_arctica.AAC.1